MKRIVLAALLVGAVALVAFPYEGTILFQGGHGAKALGMGGAFCALADDATGALWNPAGLTFVGPWIGGASSNLSLNPDEALGYQYVSGGFTFEGYAIGLGWANATAGALYSASLYLATVGIEIADFGSVGVNVKYYSETIEEDSATGFGFDIGLLFPVTDEIAVGIMAKDVGGTSIWEQTIEPMYTGAFAVRFLDGAMTLACDVDLSGMDFSFAGAKAGLEFVLVENLAVRAGVVFPEEDFATYYFTVGAGLGVGDLFIDAAYVLQPDARESLVLSATFLLGELLAPLAEEQPTE